MRFVFFISLMLSAFINLGQVSTGYYLIDASLIDQCSDHDREILESNLKSFHKSSTDTGRVTFVSNIIEHIYDQEIWPEYNLWLENFILEKLYDTTPELIEFFDKAYADVLNNKGYLEDFNGETTLALTYYNQALQLYKQYDDLDGIATVLNNMGYIYEYRGELDLALNVYNQSLKYYKSINSIDGIALLASNLGSVYWSLGDIETAMDFWVMTLENYSKLNEPEGLAIAYNNLGFAFDNQGESDKAIEYWKIAKENYEKTGDVQGIAIVLSNIASIHRSRKEYETALSLFEEAQDIYKKSQDPRGIAASFDNIGDVYSEQGFSKDAYPLWQKSLTIKRKIIDKEGEATTLNLIAYAYERDGDYVNAKKYVNQSHQIGIENGFPDVVIHSSELLAKIYSQSQEWAKAIEMLELMEKMTDSITNDNNKKVVILQHYKINHQKEMAADSIAQLELLKIKEAELLSEGTKQKRVTEEQNVQSRILYFSILGLLVLFSIGYYTYRQIVYLRKQNALIEKQKIEIENAKTLAEEKKELIKIQHENLEESHKDINDSLKYAERLQLAILPPKKDMKANLGDGFVLFQPKDVVSGDFFWMHAVNSVIKSEEKQSVSNGNITSGAEQYGNDVVLFAAADCTGHGVPGAMVSVVCSNALNRSVKEFGLTQPKDILNKTRELVIETFARSGKDVKDGMDIALCSKSNSKLTFAGANNPLWIIRKTEYLTATQKKERSTLIENDLALIEFKGNKQPIGLYSGMKEFDQHEISTFEGDTLYIFTDGFADQFGGHKGKKFKYKSFKKLLLSVNELASDDQKDYIKRTFTEWKGNLEQVDDVCVVGVKL